MTYTITNNHKFNSLEITFDGIPTLAVRTALKALRFRWHSVKKCWYGYAAESEVVNAILGAGTEEAPAEVVTDGYLGGGAVYGSKSHLHLYGADLAKAIRADLKKAGIKGVTIASKRGNIQATVATTPADILPWADFVAAYQIKPSFGWVDYTDEEGRKKTVHIRDFWTLSDDLRESIRLELARQEYDRFYSRPAALNVYHLGTYTGFTEAGLRKLQTVLDIISAYNFDESNAMVDYFHTNFYIDIHTKPSN